MTCNRNIKMINNKKLYEYVYIYEMHMYKLVTVTIVVVHAYVPTKHKA